MLVLSRNQGESVTLELPDGEVLTIHVMTVRGGEVKLSFDVPTDVLVSRTEARKVRRPKKESAK